MAENNFFKRRRKKPRQEWDPHWLIKLVYTAGSMALSLVKVAIGAAATVLLIVLICGTVFVGTLGDYLQNDILAEAACEILKDYKGVYCMESFDPRCVRWLRKNRPEIIRGQLTENFVANDKKMPLALRFVLTHNLLNFMTCPDFVAYKYADRKDTLTNPLCRHVWDLQGVSWTIKSQEDYDIAVQEGWLPIFEGFEP